jgi:hypothetical protein
VESSLWSRVRFGGGLNHHSWSCPNGRLKVKKTGSLISFSAAASELPPRALKGRDTMKIAVPTILAASPIGLTRMRSIAMAPDVPSKGSSILDAQTEETGIKETMNIDANKTTKAFFADFNMALSIGCARVLGYSAGPR